MVSCKLQHLLAALVTALMFCTASSGIIMLNKWIISVLGFKFPMTLSLIGMLFSFVCSATLACTTPWVKRTVDLTPRFMLLRAAPIGVLTALTLYFGNLAYVTLSVSFLQMLKASTPLIVLVIMFVARLETPNLSMVGSVLVIAAGTLVAAKGEVRFVWSGVPARSKSPSWLGHSFHHLLLRLHPKAQGCLLHSGGGLAGISNAEMLRVLMPGPTRVTDSRGA